MEKSKLKNKKQLNYIQATNMHQSLPLQQYIQKDYIEQDEQILAETPNVRKFEEFTVKVSGPDAMSNIHKRMKLKDYLHLKDLQKKNVSHINAKIKQNFAVKKKQKITASSLQSKQIKQKQQHLITIQDLHKQQENIDIIKTEVDSKIQQQIKKLKDLQLYLKKDFIITQKIKQSFVFLFSLYNQLNEMHKINEDIGNTVNEYTEEIYCKHTYLEPKNSGFHWQGQKKQKRLCSPAKIGNITQEQQKYRSSDSKK